MSLSHKVDQDYRLVAADLGGRSRQVLVRQVGLEGLEAVAPLLFFEGVAHPLALDHDQRAEMSRIAHSFLLADWVGAALVLRPVHEGGRETIRLLDLRERAGPTNVPHSRLNEPSPSARFRIRVALLLLLLGLAAALLTFGELWPSFTPVADFFAR